MNEMNSNNKCSGRKCHNFYKQLSFINKKMENGRRAAQCVFCLAILKNTSISRLKTHRNRCLSAASDSSFESGKTAEGNVICDLEVKVIENEKSNLMQEQFETVDIDNQEQLQQIVDGSSEVQTTYTSTNLSTSSNLRRQSFQSSSSSVTPSTSTTPDSVIMERTEGFNIKNKNPRRWSSNKVTQYIDKMEAGMKNQIDIALAKFFFGCNIPFSVVDSDNFKNFMKVIRPSYTAPCRQTLSTTLLDNVSTELMDTNKKHLPKQATLIIDGWENSSNNSKNIVTMLQTVGSPGIFLDCHDFSEIQETGEALFEICQNSIATACKQYGCEIYAVVSDNASNMVKMGRLTNLWHSTCSSHTGNLLAKDLLNLDVINKMSTILKEFKHSNLEEALISNGGSRITLPAETRWCSYRDACMRFIKNLYIMKKIAAEGRIKVKADVTHLLYDDEFIKCVQNMIQILDPVCNFINKCQQNDFSIADAVEEWLDLSKKIPESLTTDKVTLAVNHRIKMATNIYAVAANYVHPIYRGKKLCLEQKSLVREFLLEHLDREGLDGLHAFEKGVGIFEKLFEKQITSYTTFWGFADIRYPTLVELALKLINIPASSAQLERIFSNWSFVHSTLRNRLSADKSSKLLYTYYSLKLTDSNKSEQYY